MEERIVKFILKHRVLTLATADGQVPYCFSLFYVFDGVGGNFYFMSSMETRHIKDIMNHPHVAGTITAENNNVARLQGIQFTGRCIKLPPEQLEEGRKIYLSQFPYARVIEQQLWKIELDFIKMTDNTLGFGKKILWSRESHIMS
jgi:uncharacterized protein YhbP (UPF0306 family)